MTLNLDNTFINSFSDILRNQNIQLLKTICHDYNWNYDDLYELFLKDDKNIEKIEIGYRKEVKIRNQWIYQNITYYVEEDSNNVYLDDIFQGKRFGDTLYPECEET